MDAVWASGRFSNRPYVGWGLGGDGFPSPDFTRAGSTREQRVRTGIMGEDAHEDGPAANGSGTRFLAEPQSDRGWG